MTDTVVGEGAAVVRAQCHSAEIGAGGIGRSVHLSAARHPARRPTPRPAPTSRSRTPSSARGPRCRTCPTSATPRSARARTSAPQRSSSTTTACEKHRTVIGDHVRIGSDNMLVAPVTIGDGAYTAAGSVIDQDVPPGRWGSPGLGNATSRAGSRASVRGPPRTTPPGGRSAEARTAVRRSPRTRHNQSRTSRPPTPRGRARDRHQESHREDPQAVQRPGPPGARRRGRRASRRRPGPHRGLRLRQRRDLRPVRGVGSRQRRLRHPEPTPRTSTSGSWSS